MTHIEQCIADVKAAEATFEAARTALSGAKDRLQAARNEASGVFNHVLEYKQSRGWGTRAKSVARRIVVDRVKEGWSLRSETPPLIAEGFLLVASGKPGVMRGSIEVSQATDLGPYVDPVKP